MSTVKQDTRLRDILGTSALRPDGVAKVMGSFSFSSDMWAENMLWGATLRSPHPYARIISIDTTAALLISGVSAVITAQDVPGKATYGLISADQPVFASEFVRYMGEPVAAVAKCLPSGALADVLRDALVGQADRPGTSWIVLGIWALLTPLLAAKTFRWE